MNATELEVEIVRHEETDAQLAQAIGISPRSFSSKKNSNGSEFTQSEITAIRNRYNLTDSRTVEIFFS